MIHPPIKFSARDPIKLIKLLVVLVGLISAPAFFPLSGEDPVPKPSESFPASEAEAAGRARWLHETIHGALQVMHRDYFGDGDDGALSLPSQSLEDVFKEMARSWSVEIRWLGGNATQDEEHDPVDAFEKDAVKALIEGKAEYSKREGDKFRFVGAITLHNQCLKCHVPLRSSLENRVAGLAITMPLKSPAAVAVDSKADSK